ncbi:CCA tRNA nucleotidyltransferase [Clostridium sp. Mt-5]|uniref:CCA tRNA nucleotidyltransferase n=1 Tax=Clostridium moutaii TaxID=3240932 RepID=A0ABV4BLQ2_9CLOT
MDILRAFTYSELESINSIRDLCSHKGIKCYIVGGAVRDAILGNQIKDIDICIDGSPNDILNELQGLKYCQYHIKFQTASLVFKNGVSIDLIRCRKECYFRNGALPTISPSYIHEDLYRRDFTVNALAYDIEGEDIIDIYGGMQDLGNKVLRKIHSNSYREDPTRIFRAVKYAVRYNFKLEDRDEIKKCIDKGIFNTISSDRIVKEIYLLCCEDEWIKNIYLCNDLKIFSIDKHYLGNKVINGIENETNCASVDVRILRLFYSLRDEKYARILVENSILDRKLRSTMKCFIENSYKVVDLLTDTMENYKLYTILRKLNDYGLIFLSWNPKLEYKIYNYIDNLRNYKTSLNGNNIVSQGIKDGKSIGRILERIMKIELNTGIKYGQKYLAKNLGESI